MKKLIYSLIGALLISTSVYALSYNESRNRAWYLTDKMAYELNLTRQQYDKVYEVNLNYFLNINYPSDIDGPYWTYRDNDLQYILFSWQYNRYCEIAYFFRPLIWRSGLCIMTTYDYYAHDFYYYDRPAIFTVYHGVYWTHGRRPRYSPYRGMTFRAGIGMRDSYRYQNHGYYFRGGMRYDAPRYNGRNYGHIDRSRQDMRGRQDYGNENNRFNNNNNGRRFGNNGTYSRPDSHGNNYRDKNNNNNENNVVPPSNENRVNQPGNQNSGSNSYYVTNEQKDYSINNSNNASINSSKTPGGRRFGSSSVTGSGNNTRSVTSRSYSTTGSRSAMQRSSSSSNSRAISRSSAQSRSTANRSVNKSSSGTAYSSKTGKKNMSTRSFNSEQ